MYELLSKNKDFRRLILGSLILWSLVTLAGTLGVSAKEPVPANEDPAVFEDLTTQLTFSSPLEAYRQGKAAFDEGWYGLALPALRFAAKRGVFGARLKLAKMYELGLGVPRDMPAAFDLYKNISEKHWNISNFHPAAPYIGQALASLGQYYLNGIDEIGLKANTDRAARYFTHAAQFFGNPRAQYELAKLYLSGQGVKKNVRRAVAWLNNATKKKHAASQALLGQLLWDGELVPKRQIKALALLTMARENAGPADSEWINEIYKTIVAASDLKTRQGAKTAIARWVRIYKPRMKIRRIIVRKEVYIGRKPVRGQRKPVIIERKEVQIGIAGGRVVTKRVIKSQPSIDPEQRQWMGLGGFKKIDLE